MSDRYDIHLALIAIVLLVLSAWLWGNLPTVVAGLLMGLPVYCWVRLFSKPKT